MKKLLIYLIFGLLFLNIASASWYDSDWNNRIAIKINSSQVDSNLNDFPVYVDLSHLPASFWGNVNLGCSDVRVTRGDGYTELAREIVSCDTSANTGEMHFKADSLSSSADNTFYLYFNNSDASGYSATEAFGAENVWTNGYEAVFHFDESSGESYFYDSSSNSNDVSIYDSVAGQEGKMQTGHTFMGTDDARGDYGFKHGSFPEDEGAILAWVKPLDYSSNRDLNILGRSNGNWAGPTDDKSGVRWTLQYNYKEFSLGLNPYEGTDLFHSVNLSKNINVHVAINYDSNGRSLFLNGSVVANDNINGIQDGGSAYDWFLGEDPQSIREKYYSDDHLLSELRIFNSKPSETWVATEYNNQDSPESFYSIKNAEIQILPVSSNFETFPSTDRKSVV